MVISQTLNSVSKEITPTIIDYLIAAEIWTDLQDHCKQQTGLRLFQIKRDLMNLQDKLFVSYYFTRLKALWEDVVSEGDLFEGSKRA